MTSNLVIVGLSGGVDSSVAALLLLEQGWQVEAVFMKNWEEDDTDLQCTATKDLEDVTEVCNSLGIKLHTVNFSAEYWDNVFTIFLQEYKSGRTPNPDILCNKEIKFKMFLQYAKQMQAKYIATGHYAKVIKTPENYLLAKASDLTKDQSYFLYTLGQTQLQHTIFPLAEYKKTKVRDLAKKAGFINHAKKDSTGICFIGERKFKQFLQRYLPAQPGDIITTDNKLIGKHDGLMYYTIGQRQGLNIGGLKGHAGPWYVVKKDLTNNTLIVTSGKDNVQLLDPGLTATNLHWILGQPPDASFSCKAKIRYRQTDQSCSVTIKKEAKGSHCTVMFTEPQRAITPGQSVVFYQDELCIGGGIIDTVIKE